MLTSDDLKCKLEYNSALFYHRYDKITHLYTYIKTMTFISLKSAKACSWLARNAYIVLMSDPEHVINTVFKLKQKKSQVDKQTYSFFQQNLKYCLK